MVQETGQIDWTGAPELDVELLDVNEYSRPGTTLKQVNGIVIHYTANPEAAPWQTGIILRDLKMHIPQKPAVILL